MMNPEEIEFELTEVKSSNHTSGSSDEEDHLTYRKEYNMTYDSEETESDATNGINPPHISLTELKGISGMSLVQTMERMEISAIKEEAECLRKRAVEAKKNQKKSIISVAFEFTKYLYSFILLFFCIAMVMGCIFTRQSEAASYNIHPVGAFFLFWFLVFWLALIEGGQGCIVGLQPVNRAKYEDSHMVTHMITELAYKEDNLERFIIGRQFLVVLVIFLINMCGSAINGADPYGLPKIWNDIFLENGVAMIITTIVIGQLTSQVNAAVCLLDFINNYLMLCSTHLSLWIEFSGLLHCVYIVQILFTKLTGTKLEGSERGLAAKMFFWVRVIFSTILLGFCFAVTIQAILDENSGMWKGVPPWASILILFTLMSMAGLLDGMQIAAFSLINMPDEELKKHSVAYTNCQLMFSGSNLQSFLIGRQIFVASLIFIVARIASINGPEEYAIFGASPSLQEFYNTGLLGSVVLTIVGSLIWRIIASSCPLPFMSNPIIFIIIRMCLLLEKSGICSSSWGLALVHKKFVDFKPDDFYLGDDSQEAKEENV